MQEGKYYRYTLREIVFNPFNSKGSPFDEQNRLALDSKIYKSPLVVKGLKRKEISDCYIAYKITYSQYSKGGEVKSLADVQLETVALARAAVVLAKAAVPLASVALLFTQLVSGMRPAKHLSVFHQLPQDFQGTSLAIDKKR